MWTFTLLTTILISLVLIRVSDSLKTIATPPTGQCTYEGAECPNVQHYLRDYQLEYHNDTLWIYDADRLVGMHIDTSVYHGNFIDSTILLDNQ